MKRQPKTDKAVIIKRLRAWEDEYITNKCGFQKNALQNIIKLNLLLKATENG